MLRYSILGLFVACPVLAQNLTPDQRAHYWGKHLSQLREYCPLAQSQRDFVECGAEHGNMALMFLSCGEAFAMPNDRYACYETVRDLWVRENAN